MHFGIKLNQQIARAKKTGVIGLIASLATALAHADPGDETCFPLYRAAGAIPGTPPCQLTASTASVGLGNYFCTANFGIGSIERYCGSVPKDVGPSCNGLGNPINSGTGNKYQVERDYTGTGSFPLVFERYYNSTPAAAPGRSLGKLWRSNYDRTVAKVDGSTMATYRHDGKILYFTLSNGVWRSDKDISDKLVQLTDNSGTTTGWTFIAASDDSVETYNAAGSLISIKARNGQAQTLTLSSNTTPSTMAPGPNYLLQVADQFGRALKFTWTSGGWLSSLTDPDNHAYHYAYDGNGRLVSVTYPSAADASDPPKRLYAYNEQQYTGNNNLPNALTGITDENNVRFATFTYDNTSRAISTEYTDGANRYSMAYGANQTIVTDPLNTQRTFNFTKVLGSIKNSGVSQPAGAGCNAASNKVTYDANGNVASRADFNGVTTTYSYDLARNLETSRTEGSSTSQARTITTEWHPNYRLPTKIAESKRLTAYTYDESGNLLKKTVQATGDATGAQGLSAAAIGTPRTWTYAYNAAGQILTAIGPRTDIEDKTTYTYDAQGNLATITNAAGHVTTLSNYDAHGHVGGIVNPNGLTTDLAYNPRGWLTSRTVSGDGIVESTSYEYDGMGQLKSVALPGGSTISYTYDDAHRLIGIADDQGNSISYTLDPMGNRLNESVKDPGGVLVRQTSRIYDALNRLQQITGGAQ